MELIFKNILDKQKELENAKKSEKVFKIKEDINHIINSLIDHCSNARTVLTINTSLTDKIITALISTAIKETGKPPVKFAFIVMGSEGRKEQTLKTDQDNAIIYEDVPLDQLEKVRGYFIALGEKICNWLDKAGYPFCKGNVMANNEDWCLSLSEWKNNFKEWIIDAEPETIIKTKIFFDFRVVYGNNQLSIELRQYLLDYLKHKPQFFWQLAKTMLLFKPPLNFFGNITVEHNGHHKEEFSIKKAITPIIDFSRIYALKHSISEVSTWERLTVLHNRGIINMIDYQDIIEVFFYLMNLRLKYQAKYIANNSPPDNYINPKILPKLDVVMLKESFHIIESFQTKMKFDFIGQHE
ncbi:MAG: hypothetical protein GY730_05980 [bacterium]|nr:hypothetical protein [bacterium]